MFTPLFKILVRSQHFKITTKIKIYKTVPTYILNTQYSIKISVDYIVNLYCPNESPQNVIELTINVVPIIVSCSPVNHQAAPPTFITRMKSLEYMKHEMDE